MRAGRLDRLIDIEEPIETRTDSGDVSVTWEKVATVWASIEFDSGGETDSGSGELARSNEIFRIRWRRGLTAKHRIAWRPEKTAEKRYYDIRSITEIGRREGFVITASAKVP